MGHKKNMGPRESVIYKKSMGPKKSVGYKNSVGCKKSLGYKKSVGPRKAKKIRRSQKGSGLIRGIIDVITDLFPDDRKMFRFNQK